MNGELTPGALKRLTDLEIGKSFVPRKNGGTLWRMPDEVDVDGLNLLSEGEVVARAVTGKLVVCEKLT